MQASSFVDNFHIFFQLELVIWLVLLKVNRRKSTKAIKTYMDLGYFFQFSVSEPTTSTLWGSCKGRHAPITARRK